MPPKKPPPIPKTAYTLDFIMNNLEINYENPLYTTFEDIELQVILTNKESFNFVARRSDCEFQKIKTRYQFSLTDEVFQTMIESPIIVLLRKGKPLPRPPKCVDENPKNVVILNEHCLKKKKVVEIEKYIEPIFGQFEFEWKPIVGEMFSKNKFSIQTQHEEQDIFEVLPEPPPTDKKPVKEPPPPPPPLIIGTVSILLRLRVKPIVPQFPQLADDNGNIKAFDISDIIDPNDTFFVIGEDMGSKYESFLTLCNDDQCPVRHDLNKLRSLHGRLVTTTKVVSPCGNVDCSNDFDYDKEDCDCAKIISDIEKERKKNYCKNLKNKRTWIRRRPASLTFIKL